MLELLLPQHIFVEGKAFSAFSAFCVSLCICWMQLAGLGNFFLAASDPDIENRCHEQWPSSYVRGYISKDDDDNNDDDGDDDGGGDGDAGEGDDGGGGGGVGAGVDVGGDDGVAADDDDDADDELLLCV